MLFKGLADRVRGGGIVAVGVDGPLIGDRERIVPCPGCARPLVDGQGRCPGCGTLLIAGVRLRVAGFLILVGCALGMIGGALVAGAAMAPRLAAGDLAIAAAVANAPAQPVSDPAPALPAAPAGVAAPGPVEPARPTAAPVAGPGLPAGVTGGLLQVAAVNDRLAAAAVELDAALAGGSTQAAEIPVLLRRIAADVRAGIDAARRIESWAPAGDLATTALALYGTVMVTASEGLVAPLADRTAYAAAGRAVRSALADLPAVVAGTREAALLAGVDLPAAALP